jgi:PKD repeat protein
MEIRVLSNFDGDKYFSVAADVKMTETLSGGNNVLIFVVTYDLTGTMDPDYFASVISYSQEPFQITQPGQTVSVTKKYEIGPEMDVMKLKGIVMVQNIAGDHTIYQAGVSKLENLIASFSSNVVQGPPSLTVQFKDETLSTSEVLSWEWDLNGDGIVDSNEQNPFFNYIEEGTYNVSLTVTTEFDSQEVVKEGYITVTSPSNVSGKISGVWHTDKSPYCVTGDVLIPEDGSLFIEPGVEVISNNSEIKVEGYITANAIDKKQIVFTSDSSWKGIKISYSKKENTFNNVLFTKATDTALCLDYSPTTIIGSTFYKNSGNVDAGGLQVNGTNDIVFKNNTFANNESNRGCAAVEANASSFSIINSIFVNNTGFLASAVGAKGGVSMNFVNNTVANNSISTTNGFHIFNYNSYISIRNSIVRGDTNVISAFPSAVTQVERSNISGGYAGPENIDENPMFVQPSEGAGKEYDGLDALWYLQPNSPCVDAGSPLPALNDPEDPNNPGYAKFPARGTVRNDMGAYGGYGVDYWVDADNNEVLLPTLKNELVAYPNPFNPTIYFSLNNLNINDNEPISLKIYNTKGQLIKTVVDNERMVNNKTYSWNGIDNDQKDAPSGVYFIRLSSANQLLTRKVILLK